jgi:hypothetical protein
MIPDDIKDKYFFMITDPENEDKKDVLNEEQTVIKEKYTDEELFIKLYTQLGFNIIEEEDFKTVSTLSFEYIKEGEEEYTIVAKFQFGKFIAQKFYLKRRVYNCF